MGNQRSRRPHTLVAERRVEPDLGVVVMSNRRAKRPSGSLAQNLVSDSWDGQRLTLLSVSVLRDRVDDAERERTVADRAREAADRARKGRAKGTATARSVLAAKRELEQAQAQMATRIRDAKRRNPELSNRAIAEQLHVRRSTVATVLVRARSGSRAEQPLS
jgi:hypothetical protein